MYLFEQERCYRTLPDPSPISYILNVTPGNLEASKFIFPHESRWAFTPGSACACVNIRAHARLCVRMCVVALVPAHVCVRQ